MPARIPRTGTEDTRNAITINVGTVDQIISVGLYHTLTPAGSGEAPPAPTDFTAAQLVKPGDPLADGNNLDILALIGPKAGTIVLTPGDWQVWGYIETDRQDIIRPLDVLTIY
jgi:hypothetical protein